MAIKTSVKVKQDYLLSLRQAERAAKGILDPKKLLIKSDLRITLETKKEPNAATLILLEKEVDKYILDFSQKTADKIESFVDKNRKKPDFVAKKLEGFTKSIQKDFPKEVDTWIHPVHLLSLDAQDLAFMRTDTEKECLESVFP